LHPSRQIRTIWSVHRGLLWGLLWPLGAPPIRPPRLASTGLFRFVLFGARRQLHRRIGPASDGAGFSFLAAQRFADVRTRAAGWRKPKARMRRCAKRAVRRREFLILLPFECCCLRDNVVMTRGQTHRRLRKSIPTRSSSSVGAAASSSAFAVCESTQLKWRSSAGWFVTLRRPKPSMFTT